MVRRVIEDEIADKATPSSSPNLCCSRVEELEKEYDIEAVLSSSKGEKPRGMVD